MDIVKEPILLRIKEIFNQNDFKSKKILNLNFTTWETLFPERELLDEKYIITNQRGKFNEILSSIESLSGKKFDLIFLQLPLGIKTPDPNIILLELIDKNLVENGVVLNLSTMNSFSIRLEKHFPNFTRFRENILGEIYKPETGNKSFLIWVYKGSNEWTHGCLVFIHPILETIRMVTMI